jgi:hypothetical protein
MKLVKSIEKTVKKLLKNQTFLLLGVIAVGVAVYYYSKGFASPFEGASVANEAAQAADVVSNEFMPSKPLGQNAGHASAQGAVTDTYGLPPSCAKQQVTDPSELLPKQDNNEFSRLNPMGSGDLKNVSLLKAGWHIGINTVGQSLRNANLQVRSEPPNPQVNTGPWNQSTISSDTQRRPLEIGTSA